MSIKVSGVSKKYKEQQALDNVSFAIEKGEVVGFLGPNGAGKSTMMKILTTTILATNGDVEVNELDVNTQTDQVRKSIGYLPEHNPLYLEMYVREYLQFNAGLFKVDRKKVDTVIEQTGLTPEAHKKIGQLSKGYRQRVGLAAALLHEPEVLILDEPTTGLDPNQLVDIRTLIKTFGKDRTVLLSTHIMQEVEAICDRVIIINKGKIVADKNLVDLRKGQQQVVEVEFDYRVEEVALNRIEHVQSVKNVEGFLYELTFDTNTDMRSVVFDFAHDNQLKILKLDQQNQNLETLFRELTA
ncbi:gliding motility-associated ABC transporter ATP-binding subunit GldA [Spongiivirga citrea]|uniref:Gliding motility-associated ABC transporter ATP-binding subunit GldA n=1 Tax=Spongiivirga citrea TaxID=1481457 RepID=A0A6M0CLI8_9FLAO|nr:gliding motility-associated ABC transporter ATP-binding subunit GldA [Spongiivirga citrea]NER18798.1 gliding motility-associated ABC transporter ATP-binding subunit GldA [Spongiivirga citrea]